MQTLSTFTTPSLCTNSNFTKEEVIPATPTSLTSSLRGAARENDDFSIDCLFSLACENSRAGQQAASFLFDLYTGKEIGHPDLPEQLAKDSLKFFEIISERNKNRPLNDAWPIPEKILIMAGFACQRETQQHENILVRINNNELIHSYLYDGEPGCFFDTNRLISASEIQSVTRQLNDNNQGITFHETTALDADEVNNNHIPEKLFSILVSMEAGGGQKLSGGDFIPLLIRDHWVLFGLKTGDEGQRTAVLFDSDANLREGEIDFLRTLADYAGAENFLPLSAKLQEYAPNACAVFVCKAMTCIANEPAAPAEVTLQAFIDTFVALTATEQARFNKQGRAELYGSLLDTLAPTAQIGQEP